VELVRKARNAEVPASFYTDPLMYQGGSDSFVGPRDPIYVLSEEWGIDLEAEVAVITGDVRMGATPEEAAKAIRLVMLVNDVSLRNLIPNELAKGFGFFQSKPASAFSPVAVTPDELGADWATTSAPAAAGPSEQPAFRQAERRRRHDLQLRPAGGACRATRELGAGAIIGSAPCRTSRAACMVPASPTAAWATAAWPKCACTKPSRAASRKRRSSSSATACASR
jgi:fumarylacetoacetate (FAA) hydrolase